MVSISPPKIMTSSGTTFYVENSRCSSCNSKCSFCCSKCATPFCSCTTEEKGNQRCKVCGYNHDRPKFDHFEVIKSPPAPNVNTEGLSCAVYFVSNTASLCGWYTGQIAEHARTIDKATGHNRLFIAYDDGMPYTFLAPDYYCDSWCLIKPTVYPQEHWNKILLNSYGITIINGKGIIKSRVTKAKVLKAKKQVKKGI